ncbi:MAG: hypothetical protein PHS53_01970 [Candidatus Pacebacteria bacterium]|nr:hypothetical protein [Candidatus Paceibacterota bacterium]MDD5356892.1 hypothetical protein [Candidatus Paceibacterota bacterium]
MLPKDIQDIIDGSAPISIDSEKAELARKLVEEAYKMPQKEIGLSLAAAFDLLVSAEYYGRVTNRGWIYCPHNGNPLLLFSYTNICPRCNLAGKFKYHKSNKPSSGSIGAIAVDLLGLMLKILFEKHGRKIEIFKAAEPADLIFYEKEKHIVLFAEVKSSPLVTMPLATNTEKQTEESGDQEVESGHLTLNNTNLSSNKLGIFLPLIEKKGERGESYKIFDIGIMNQKSKKDWVYKGINDLLKTDFFKYYHSFWLHAFKTYEARGRLSVGAIDPIYWMTNACGQPWPRPENWPQRRVGASGYESISDSKSSVGMDRTDDIKKGTYQVLKLGATNKPKIDGINIKTGLLSNLHAIRHFEEYLQDLKDVVWTKDQTGKAKRVKDLPPNEPLYNLYDGIVSFSSTYARDEWVKENFSF